MLCTAVNTIILRGKNGEKMVVQPKSQYDFDDSDETSNLVKAGVIIPVMATAPKKEVEPTPVKTTPVEVEKKGPPLKMPTPVEVEKKAARFAPPSVQDDDGLDG